MPDFMGLFRAGLGIEGTEGDEGGCDGQGIIWALLLNSAFRSMQMDLVLIQISIVELFL